MTVRIAGGALGTLRRLLGLSGGPQETFLDLGNVSPTLDILRFVRQSNHLGQGEGFVGLTIENSHAGAGDVVTALDPYNPDDASNGYPDPVPADRDIWLIDVTVRPATSADYGGTWDQAVVNIFDANLPLGASTSPTAAGFMRCVYASTGTVIGLGIADPTQEDPAVMVGENNSPRSPVATRIPRGAEIVFASQKTNAGTDVLQANLLAMLLPSGIGQGGAF